MEISFDMNYAHTAYNNFTENDSKIIISLIEKSRLGNMLWFDSYATIAYEDDMWLHGKANYIEKFKRSKVNAIIFNFKDYNNMNPGYYNKMILMHSIGVNHSYYNIVFVNTETGVSHHIPFIDHDYNDLTRVLNETMYRINGKINKYKIKYINDPIKSMYVDNHRKANNKNMFLF